MAESRSAPPPTFPFHHGRLALSFAGTVGDRGSLPVERLSSPRALGAWLRAAGLTAPEASPPLAVYRRALRLREAIARAVAALVAGARPAAEDVALLNAVARRWAPRPTLDPDTLALASGAGDPVQAALGRVAVDAIELLADPEQRSRLRACALDACGAVFLTPPGRRERRWCSMARCGNRAKVTAFRARSAQGRPEPK